MKAELGTSGDRSQAPFRHREQGRTSSENAKHAELHSDSRRQCRTRTQRGETPCIGQDVIKSLDGQIRPGVEFMVRVHPIPDQFHISVSGRQAK